MWSKRLIQLAGVVGVLGLAACSGVAEPRYESDDRLFVPTDQPADSTLLSDVWSGR